MRATGVGLGAQIDNPSTGWLWVMPLRRLCRPERFSRLLFPLMDASVAWPVMSWAPLALNFVVDGHDNDADSLSAWGAADLVQIYLGSTAGEGGRLWITQSSRRGFVLGVVLFLKFPHVIWASRHFRRGGFLTLRTVCVCFAAVTRFKGTQSSYRTFAHTCCLSDSWRCIIINEQYVISATRGLPWEWV